MVGHPSDAREIDPMNPRYAATFARKSDLDDQGIQDQHDLCISAAQRDGYAVPDHRTYRYSENAISGAADRRPELERLRSLVEAGQAPFSRVYVKARDRLGRFADPDMHAFYKVLFKNHGVEIVFLDEPHVNSNQPGAVMVRSVMGALKSVQASEERSKLIARVTTGMRSRVKAGHYPGATAAYGYDRCLVDDRTLLPVRRVTPGHREHLANHSVRLYPADDGSPDVVLQIFKHAARGDSAGKIARTLNEEKRLSPAARLKPGIEFPWKPNAVLRILRNPIYAGILVWGRKTRSKLGSPVPIDSADLANEKLAVVNERFIDAPLIPLDLWQEVQVLLNGRQNSSAGRRANKPAFILSSLLKCAVCQRRFEGATSGAARRKTYRHSHRNAGLAPCTTVAKYIPAIELEQRIEAVVTDWLATGAHLEPLKSELRRVIAADASPNREARLLSIRDQIITTQSAATQAARLATQAPTPDAMATYQSIVEEHTAKLTSLRQEESRLISASAIASDALHRLDEQPGAQFKPAETYEAADPAERKRLLSSIFSAILLHPDRLTVELVLQDLTRHTNKA